MKEQLYIYYTNDLHSNFTQWPKIASYLKEAKTARKLRQQDYWVVDIGDHMDRVHPISEAFMGKANVELMNDLQYDIATIGNNEGITLSHDDLFHLYDDAQFEVVCTNLHSLMVDEPSWLRRKVHVESHSGVKIGFIGLTAPFNEYYYLLKWHISYLDGALERYVKMLKNEVDVIVLLSHLGLSEDRIIAEKYKDIDVIIGGHTHHLLRNGELVNETLLTAAGKHGSFIGEVILTWDHSLKKLVNKEAYAIDITDYHHDEETKNKIISLQEEADQRLEYPIVTIEEPIEVKWYEHTEIMQELTNTLQQFTKAEIAMLNSGVLLESLPAGNITYKDVHRICPHPINPVTVYLTGREIIEVIRMSLTKQFQEFELKGFGFRGKVLGKMVFSGITIKTEFHANGDEYVKAVYLSDGSKLDGNKEYKVATGDVFTFGRLLPEIARSNSKRFFLPEFLRDLLVDTLKRMYR